MDTMPTSSRIDSGGARVVVRQVLSVRLAPAAARAVSTTPTEILQAWFERMTPTRRRVVQRGLEAFASWATGDDKAGPTTALQLLVEAGCGSSHALVRAWRDSLLEQGLATGTVAGCIAVVGSLTRAAREAELLNWNLERCAPRPEPKHDRSGPTRGNVERLVAHLQQLVDGGDARATRDLALVALLHNAALRRQEALQLTLADLDLDGDEPVVWTRRKGYRERRRVSIGTDAAERLRRWLVLRGDEAGAVFCRVRQATTKAVAMTGENVRRMLATRAREAGIDVPVRPHGLRHSAATELLRTGGTIAELQALGGWRSLASASHYVDQRQSTRLAAIARIAL